MKRKLLAVLMSVACIAASSVPSSVVLADGQKVVTLGADLSEEQKQAILRYFGIEGQNLQTLTITNQDERNHLGAYVPIEQIGTRTISCALVNPTASGGIQVKTANFNWVTSNMIASTLSTSGVKNCEVLAAAPFEVSGTGALTGIIMAYETAVGEPLDTQKKEVATQELVTTSTVANNIGQQQAANVVNEAKIQVIQGKVIDEQDIKDIVEDVASDQNVDLSDEDRELIMDLMEQIADQNYDYDEMKETLERVENNLNELTSQSTVPQIEGSGTVDTTPQEPVSPEMTEPAEPETLAPDSILTSTDDSALGESVKMDATNQEALPDETQAPQTDAAQTEAPQTEAPQQSESGEGGIVIPPASDVYVSPEGGDQENPDSNSTVLAPQESDAGSGIPGTGDSGIEIPQGNTDVFFTDENGSLTNGETQPQDGQNGEPQDGQDGNLLDNLFGNIFGENTEEPDAGETPTEEAPAGEMPTEETPAGETPTEEAPAEELPVTIPLTDLRFVEVTSDVNNYEPLPAGISELTICFINGDYTPGTGTLTVYRESDGSVFDTVSLGGSDRVVAEPISDPELLSRYGWESGYQMVIALNQPLEANESFYVTFTEGILTSLDGTATSEALTDTSSWCISTLADGLVLDRNEPFLRAGSQVSGHILMDTELGAVSASVSNVDPSAASFDVTEFTADSPDFTLTLNGKGTTTFQIQYFDAEGNAIDTIDYTVTVR